MKKVFSEKLLFSTNLSLLICSLYTLSEHHRVFKKTNIRYHIPLNLVNLKQFSNDIEPFLEFDKLLNNSSLRRFAYDLIEPYLTPKPFLSNLSIDKSLGKETFAKTFFLKRYLQKFKYNYRRYFFFQNRNYKHLSLDKEINMHAIKMLFLLAGI
jgi:hypothetical protein